MIINRSNIFEILKEFGLRPEKDYGQNFLIDDNASQRIVSFLNASKEDKVLEIGPGLGSLTHHLVLTQCDLSVVDVDPMMCEFIKFIYKENAINVIENDIRKTDISEYNKIIGNLPYNITTETISYLLLNFKKCQKFVLMCQEETFNHFNDVSGKEYGPLSVLIHLLGNIKRLLTVKPSQFHPAPKCKSVVFEIDIDDNCDVEFVRNVYRFAKQMFSNRRKTIFNNLKSVLKDSSLCEEILKESHIFIETRPEQISPSQYVNLYKIFKYKV